MQIKDAKIDTVVTVNDPSARNPGGYGRITRRNPKRGLVRVDSGDYEGQEVTGWYKVENLELFDWHARFILKYGDA